MLFIIIADLPYKMENKEKCTRNHEVVTSDAPSSSKYHNSRHYYLSHEYIYVYFYFCKFIYYNFI